MANWINAVSSDSSKICLKKARLARWILGFRCQNCFRGSVMVSCKIARGEKIVNLLSKRIKKYRSQNSLQFSSKNPYSSFAIFCLYLLWWEFSRTINNFLVIRFSPPNFKLLEDFAESVAVDEIIRSLLNLKWNEIYSPLKSFGLKKGLPDHLCRHFLLTWKIRGFLEQKFIPAKNPKNTQWFPLVFSWLFTWK